jgi:hypothetical protein
MTIKTTLANFNALVAGYHAAGRLTPELKGKAYFATQALAMALGPGDRRAETKHALKLVEEFDAAMRAK